MSAKQTLQERIDLAFGRNCPAHGGINGFGISIIRDLEIKLEETQRRADCFDELVAGCKKAEARGLQYDCTSSADCIEADNDMNAIHVALAKAEAVK